MPSGDLALPALWSGTALNALGLRSLQVVAGNPFLGVSSSASGDSWTVGVGFLAANIDLFDTSGSARTLALLLLWEIRNDPDVVEEEANTTGAGKEEEVEEDDLGVEHARIGIDNLDGTVESLSGVELSALAEDSSQVQAKFSWVHVGGQAVWQGLALASWDLDAILLGGQVADNLGFLAREVGSPEAATDELNGNGLGLSIVDGELHIRRLAIDDLNAKDLGVEEFSVDLDVESSRLAGVLDVFFEVSWSTLSEDGGVQRQE